MSELNLVPVKQEVEEFLYNFQEVKITCANDYTQAGDVLKQIQLKIKKLEDKRKEYTSPLDESKKRIMADFKTITEPLEKFVADVKVKMVIFYEAEQKRLDEEQKRIEAEAIKKAKETNTSEVVVPVINNIKTQRGDVATATVQKKWVFEVIEANDVPKEYLSPDDDKIKSAVDSGVREIKGVKIFEKSTVYLR